MSTCSERLAAAAPPTKPAGGRSGSVARHATPCTHYHARDGAEQEHAFTQSQGSTVILWLGPGTILSNYVKTMAYQCQNRMGFLNYVKVLAYYFFYWTVTLFGGHRFFTPPNKHFPSICRILCLLFGCLNFGSVVLRNLDTDLVCHITATNKTPFGSNRAPPRSWFVKLQIIPQGQGSRCGWLAIRFLIWPSYVDVEGISLNLLSSVATHYINHGCMWLGSHTCVSGSCRTTTATAHMTSRKYHAFSMWEVLVLTLHGVSLHHGLLLAYCNAFQWANHARVLTDFL